MGIKSNNISAVFHDFFSRSGKDAVNPYVPPVPFSATGGTEYTPGNGYKYHLFDAPGDFTTSGDQEPIHIVVIGGGGAGGNCGNGGGGAGGLVMNPNYLCPIGPHTITIGAGGYGLQSGCGTAQNGSNTTFSVPDGTPIIAVGGGGGGGADSTAGNPGGSGGGGSYSQSGGSGSNPPNGPYPGFTVYGNNGNPGPGGGSAGGGGGAGGTAQPSPNPGQYGGSGLQIPEFAVTGMPTMLDGTGSGYWAAGGGSYQGPAGPFRERQPNGAPGYTQAGRANSGDGSGGQPPAAPGGNGTVMIRYAYSQSSSPSDFTINGVAQSLPTGWDSGLNAGRYTMVIGSSPITVTLKMWGAGGGCGPYHGHGGGGGYSTATATLAAGQTYSIVVGQGGKGTGPGADSITPIPYGGGGGGDTNLRGGGGGFSAIFSGGVAFANVGLLAGGGGGGGAAPPYAASTTQTVAGGAGGGTNGLNGSGPSPQATGGTPSARGGGTALPTNYVGGQLQGMSGRGGGGGGYYGGGAGYDNGSASPGGGGGSAYTGGHPNIPLSGASTTAGGSGNQYGQAANNTDPYWGGAGYGAGPNTPLGSAADGNPGRVVIYN